MAYPECLLAELRTALAHLHDPAYLESHPLAMRISAVAQAPDLTRGQLLRRTLRLSIEALDPGPDIPANSPEARPYQILRGRYIRQQSLGEVAIQIDIGRRQAYRELGRAIRALADMLRDGGVLEGDGLSAAALMSGPASRLRAEIDRLAAMSCQEVDIIRLAERAIESIRPLAEERGITLRLQAETTGLHTTVNRVMLRQAILNLLSHAVRLHQEPELAVRLRHAGGKAVIQMAYRPAGAPGQGAGAEGPYAAAVQLLEALGVAWRHEPLAGGAIEVAVHIPLAQEHRILAIDDNEGLIRLFERYLEGQPYRLFSTTRAEQALQMLKQLTPEVIILDVMMPEHDGWEVLEALRRSPAGRRARILVCSIVDDPQLAAALGVDGFLHKPVDRTSLLQSLERLVNSPAVDGRSQATYGGDDDPRKRGKMP